MNKQKIDFIKKQIKKAIIIIVLVPAGLYKTTWLKSYINYLMNFIYKLKIKMILIPKHLKLLIII